MSLNLLGPRHDHIVRSAQFGAAQSHSTGCQGMNNAAPFATALARTLRQPTAFSSFGTAGMPAQPARRDRIWDLSPNLHCSLIGTCLTNADLRQLLSKLGEPDARTLSDHALHGRAVTMAGRKEGGGKLLQKLLDRKHESDVKRFAKAHEADGVRELWRDALERGDIPGAYWAVITHPATDRALVQEVFGDVHMLSHLVGQANRTDIRRLRHLERDLAAAQDKMARQEARIRAGAEDRRALQQQLQAALDLAGSKSDRLEVAIPANHDAAAEIASLRERLAREQAHQQRVDMRVRELVASRDEQDREVLMLRGRETALQEEVAVLEAMFDDKLPDQDSSADPLDLHGLTLLYVGGRPRQVGQVRRFTDRHGIVLLGHDGGVEDSSHLLPGLTSQADAVLFPVDCVSHDAVSQVKRLCRDTGKIFLPLRTASIASFVSALRDERLRALRPNRGNP